MDNVELKRKVSLKRKGGYSVPPQSSKPKKPKWWIWLLPIILIGAIIWFVKSGSTNSEQNMLAESEVEQTHSVTADEAPVSASVTISEETTSTQPEHTQASTGKPAGTPDENKSASDNADRVATQEVPVKNSGVTSTNGVSNQARTTSQSAASTTNLSQDGLEGKAWEVIKGSFGNGEERKQKLGSDYAAIQQKVNELYRNGQVR